MWRSQAHATRCISLLAVFFERAGWLLTSSQVLNRVARCASRALPFLRRHADRVVLQPRTCLRISSAHHLLTVASDQGVAGSLRRQQFLRRPIRRHRLSICKLLGRGSRARCHYQDDQHRSCRAHKNSEVDSMACILTAKLRGLQVSLSCYCALAINATAAGRRASGLVLCKRPASLWLDRAGSSPAARSEAPETSRALRVFRDDFEETECVHR
jgi:hypothetical protein